MTKEGFATVGWNKFWREYRGTPGTAFVRPIASWIFPLTKRSQFPLAVSPRMEQLERWTRVGDIGFYTAVCESWMHGCEAQSGWGAAKAPLPGKVRRSCAILFIQVRTREKCRGRWRAASWGTWRSSLTNFMASFWTLFSTWESREDACIA